MRRVEQLLGQYSEDHRNHTNQIIHLFCVPAIVWSVTALLWCIPVPMSFLKPGAFCGFAMALASMYYWRLSRTLALGLVACFIAAGFLNYFIATQFGMTTLLIAGITVFVIAWIVQFIGHKIEGKRPSFLTDVVYLLVGPMWTLNKLYRKIGVSI
jgi:uncharacterized membrane protein YGL010W